MSLKDLGYTPRQASVRIIFDDNLRAEVDRARAALKKGKPDPALGDGLEQAVEQAETAVDEAAVSFTFQALARHQLTSLVAECPPSSEQLERWKESVKAAPLLAQGAPEFDYETFAPRLIAASLVSPDTTEAEVVEMWEKGDWSDAVWATLWKTAWGVNQEVSTRPT